MKAIGNGTSQRHGVGDSDDHQSLIGGCRICGGNSQSTSSGGGNGEHNE